MTAISSSIPCPIIITGPAVHPARTDSRTTTASSDPGTTAPENPVASATPKITGSVADAGSLSSTGASLLPLRVFVSSWFPVVVCL
jgi:hypothetical protein